MDVLLSYITAEKPVGRVAPMSSSEKCIEAAKLLDKAINFWDRRDDRDLKQYEWMLAALIYGVSPAKIHWAYERAEESWRVPILDPVTGEESGERLERQEVDVRNQPSMALVSPFNFAWDPAATSSDLRDAEFVVHWSYPSLRNVKSLDVESTPPPRGIYYNTDEISERSPQEPQKGTKGQDLTGHVEVCEVWSRDRLVVLANGATCIRDIPNPFMHHDLPFIIGTTQVSLPGELEPSSEVDLITPIQNDLWNIYAQYRENMDLANRMTILYDATGYLDEEKIVNVLRGDKRITAIPVDSAGGAPPVTWNPATALLSAGQAGMQGYKTDMDDMSGVGAYVSGTEEKSVDPRTATEVSTLQGAAMRRINKTRNMLAAAQQRGRNQELKLVKQFMTKPLEIRIEGYNADSDAPGRDWSWDYVDPSKVMDADVEYVIRDADENLDQEQKRSAAALRLQMTLSVAAAAPALGQGSPNVKKAFEEFIEAQGEEDSKEWWIDPPPPPPPVLPTIAPTGPLNGAAPNGASGLGGASPLGPPTPPVGGPGRAATLANGSAI